MWKTNAFPDKDCGKAARPSRLQVLTNRVSGI
jgi:hypothetical protein